MKINNSMINELVMKRQKSEKAEGEAALSNERKSGAESPADSGLVNISEEAALLEKAKKIMKEESDVDMRRVEHFKKLIAEGHYELNNAKIAERIAELFKGGRI